MNIKIDVEQFARDIKAGKSIGGKDGALGSLIKQLTEAALAAETIKSVYGEFDLDIPRDRNGSLEPEIVKKNQRTMSGEIEEKILALYAHGNNDSQIADMIEDIYGVGFSKSAISTVTNKITPILQEWKERDTWTLS